MCPCTHRRLATEENFGIKKKKRVKIVPNYTCKRKMCLVPKQFLVSMAPSNEINAHVPKYICKNVGFFFKAAFCLLGEKHIHSVHIAQFLNTYYYRHRYFLGGAPK